jgi:tryptophan synthase alpha chain
LRSAPNHLPNNLYYEPSGRSVYFTAGFPHLEDTELIIRSLADSGADMIEVGMPFSDSMVDGPTIQASNAQALANGMNLSLYFKQLAAIRQSVDLPLIYMGYLNQPLQFGMEKFCAECQKVGIDGLILPDIPLQVYENEYKSLFEKYELYPIFLITPQTPEARVRQLDAASKGFLYLVAASATTGIKSGIDASQETYFQKISRMNLQNPLLIGFGISDQATFSTACAHANGAIIGSAFIKEIAASSDLKRDISAFVKKIRG